MTEKSTKQPKPKTKKRSNVVEAPGTPDEDPDLVKARNVLRPTVHGAVAIKEYTKSFGDLEIMGLVEALGDQTEAVLSGNLGRGEAMLTAQAHTLDAIFNNLSRRAINAEYMDHLSSYLKLALRAQAQCRATWETVSTVKNPPMMGYVKQANIAHGHQQVNNAPRAGENQNPKNELLEAPNDERMDLGETRPSGGADTAMAPVGSVDRT